MTRQSLGIVICTHDPDPAVFVPCLEAIARLRWPGSCAPEILLVDNGSEPPLAQWPWAMLWIEQTPGARLLREDRLGHSHALARGFGEATGRLLVSFDDDNLPDADYLEGVVQAAESHPFVGVWGPGRVEVQWMEGADPRVVAEHARDFQEHCQSEVSLAANLPRPTTLPYGTGMVLRREVAEHYARCVAEGTVATTGRCGAVLASAEDKQIVWLALRDGWSVGRHPALRVRHRIPARRAQPGYVARLRFAHARSHAPALREILPEYAARTAPGSLRIAARCVRKTLRWLLSSRRHTLRFALAPTLGKAVGAWEALEQRPPAWVRALTRRLYRG